MDYNNEWKDNELENPELVNMLDYSYSFVRNVGIRNFLHKDRDNYEISDLDFSNFGFFIEKEYNSERKGGSGRKRNMRR